MARIEESYWQFLMCLLLCNFANGWMYPFLNTNLSWGERVQDLVNRLSLYEIVEQATAAVSILPPSVGRLGIKPYLWDTECLRGYTNRNATAFPDSLGLAASFRFVRIYVIVI